jgi:inositol transport system substrate-binding protein
MGELVKMLSGKGNVVIMLGELASNGTTGRTAGFKGVLKNYPDIKVIEEQTANFDRTQAINLMSNWISKGDKIDAVAANNDEMALGALIAMHQAGISPQKVFVGGVDATPDALAAMQKGDLAVTVFQNAKGQANGAVDLALKLAKGEKVEQFDWIPFELVTQQNYKTFLNR